MKTLFLIPARGGSKGIPRKNVRALGGRPLIAYAIATAKELSSLGDVYVTSEDDEILNLSVKLGARTHRRQPDLAADAIALDDVVCHAVREIASETGEDYDVVVTLQPTSPLLRSASVDAALAAMRTDESIETMISAINDTHLTWSHDGTSWVPNYEKRVNRQQLTPIFRETGGFLIARSKILDSGTRIGKRVELFELSPRESIDIDTFDDWSLCEYHLRRKRIVFAVTGHPGVGLGHVYNSLIVANEILDHEILFCCDKDSSLAYDKICANNYPCFLQESDDLIADIMSLNPDVVINDRLDTNESDIKELRNRGISVVNFEDLGEGAQYADLVFNAMYPERACLENHFFGPTYFCARDEFLLTPVRELSSSVHRVLLAFGGVDPNDLTRKVLDSIHALCRKAGIAIRVVTGLGYANAASLEAYDEVEVYRNVANISDLMSEADVAFTSAGRTAYELALLGVPSIVLAQNERELTHVFATAEHGFVNLGLGVDASTDFIRSALAALIDDRARRIWMRGLMLNVDLRRGKTRVIREIRRLLEPE